MVTHYFLQSETRYSGFSLSLAKAFLNMIYWLSPIRLKKFRSESFCPRLSSLANSFTFLVAYQQSSELGPLISSSTPQLLISEWTGILSCFKRKFGTIYATIAKISSINSPVPELRRLSPSPCAVGVNCRSSTSKSERGTGPNLVARGLLPPWCSNWTGGGSGGWKRRRNWKQ